MTPTRAIVLFALSALILCAGAETSPPLELPIELQLDEYRHHRHDHELVDHAQALREITSVDDEWSQR